MWSKIHSGLQITFVQVTVLMLPPLLSTSKLCTRVKLVIRKTWQPQSQEALNIWSTNPHHHWSSPWLQHCFCSWNWIKRPENLLCQQDVPWSQNLFSNPLAVPLNGWLSISQEGQVPLAHRSQRPGLTWWHLALSQVHLESPSWWCQLCPSGTDTVLSAQPNKSRHGTWFGEEAFVSEAQPEASPVHLPTSDWRRVHQKVL